MSHVLVVSPHPDDESIGCGGTLRKHVVHGDEVRVIYLTSGEKGGHGLPPDETKRVREAEARAAARVLGITHVEFWEKPDGRLRPTPQLVQRLRQAIELYSPERVYVTHDREMHPDHRAASEVVRRAVAEPIRCAEKPAVLMFEVWTPLQDMDEIVDITPYVRVKSRAIRAHASQCAVMRFDAAALALARYRGEMHSWPGGDYAEIFLQLR